MREPLLADDVEEIPDYYDDPDIEVLDYATESLSGMERLEQLVGAYQQQRLKQGEAEGLLEEGYSGDDHIAFTWEATDDEGEEQRMIVDSYTIDDRLDRLETELHDLRRDIVETVADLRDWSGEAEETDGPVKAVSIAYNVVNHSLSGDADQSGSVAMFREQHPEAYRRLARYADNRKSLTPSGDTLDRYVTRDGTFRRDDLFGVAASITLEGVETLDDMFDENAETGRAIARTATERMQEREAGKELVQPFNYELMQEQRAMQEPEDSRDGRISFQ